MNARSVALMLALMLVLTIFLTGCFSSGISREEFLAAQATQQVVNQEMLTAIASMQRPTPTPTATPTPTPTATPTAIQPPPPATISYPLAGQRYQAWINGSPDTSGQYDAVWINSGWLWQPNLPPEGQRSGFVMSITIEEGHYTFAGVSCRLHLDVSRNGQGANNPKTVGYGNGLAFTVDTADNGQAWAFIVCDPTDVTGFSVQYEGPLP